MGIMKHMKKFATLTFAISITAAALLLGSSGRCYFTIDMSRNAEQHVPAGKTTDGFDMPAAINGHIVAILEPAGCVLYFSHIYDRRLVRQTDLGGGRIGQSWPTDAVATIPLGAFRGRPNGLTKLTVEETKRAQSGFHKDWWENKIKPMWTLNARYGVKGTCLSQLIRVEDTISEDLCRQTIYTVLRRPTTGELHFRSPLPWEAEQLELPASLNYYEMGIVHTPYCTEPLLETFLDEGPETRGHPTGLGDLKTQARIDAAGNLLPTDVPSCCSGYSADADYDMCADAEWCQTMFPAIFPWQ